MLDVDNLVQQHCPKAVEDKPLIARPLTKVLRLLFHEKDFKQFEQDYPHLEGFDFVEQCLAHFGFSYRVRDNERESIPNTGRAVIIANHPIGSLDGLALLKMVREIRPDVKVVANELLATIKPLKSLLLANPSNRTDLAEVRQQLEDEGALIVFPANDVSRPSIKGVRDKKWDSTFLRLASSTKSPVLPVFVDGRNSAFFYALSFMARPVSTLWRVREMFRHASSCIDIRIGAPVSYDSYQQVAVPIREKVRLFKHHLYRIGKGKRGFFSTEVAISHPENRALLKEEIEQCKRLGETADGKQIYLYYYKPNSSIMREIGRLREIAFRAVGEGSGGRRDNDLYDQHYMHLLLWDPLELEIAGAYRFCDASESIDTMGQDKLYSASLFNYNKAMKPYFERGLELGRSFVQPKYWGKRSLEYLWYGIGAFLRENPNYRYLFGPVTLSDTYSEHAKDMIVHFYSKHFPALQPLADCQMPYTIASDKQQQLNQQFPGKDYREEFVSLKGQLSHMNCSVPTLYKQYTEICEPNGVQFAGFNIDPDFKNAIDGLIVVDLANLKPNRRERYLGIK
ncbi:lysophospholipid acyltransferase family protein [bacterium SCSIO 12696]|nr:lysophospholipid acyltransferase family protein [bacterium SCSIO 12696]